MAGGPLDQFKVKTLYPIEVGGVDISFTNASLAMCVAVGLLLLFVIVGSRKAKMVPGRWQSMVEMSYQMIANMVKDNVGNEGRPYFPFIFTLFMFVVFCNLGGLLPYNFTATSHIIVTFALAFIVFLGVTLIGIFRHGLHFFSLFMPSGTPKIMLPLIIPIEVISYLARPISLSIRLAANMMAGHTLLKIMAIFTVSLGVAGILPFSFIVVLTGFEIFVAILQAFIFTILTCIYLNDAIHLH